MRGLLVEHLRAAKEPSNGPVVKRSGGGVVKGVGRATWLSP